MRASALSVQIEDKGGGATLYCKAAAPRRRLSLAPPLCPAPPPSRGPCSRVEHRRREHRRGRRSEKLSMREAEEVSDLGNHLRRWGCRRDEVKAELRQCPSDPCGQSPSASIAWSFPYLYSLLSARFFFVRRGAEADCYGGLNLV
jgi:hypothetical protein